jgi:hypothetical protein
MFFADPKPRRNQLKTVADPPCVLRVVDRFTVDAAGRITQQENHYDPRPALAPIS